jgi:hypothetical protein
MELLGTNGRGRYICRATVLLITHGTAIAQISVRSPRIRGSSEVAVARVTVGLAPGASSFPFVVTVGRINKNVATDARSGAGEA